MHFYKLYGIEFLSLVEKSKFHPITFSCFKMKTVYLQVKIFLMNQFTKLICLLTERFTSQKLFYFKLHNSLVLITLNDTVYSILTFLRTPFQPQDVMGCVLNWD